MKRYGVLLFIAVLVGGFLFMRGPRSSSTAVNKAPAVVEANKSSQTDSKDQASTSPPIAEEPIAKSGSEEVLFRGNGSRDHLERNSLPRRGGTPTPLPGSAAALRPTALWPDQTWQVWRGVRAVEGQSLGKMSGTQLGQLGHYTIVEDSGLVVDEHQFSSTSPIPVYNPHRNKAGLITGVFAVVLQDAQDFESFIFDYDLKIMSAQPQLRVYYLMPNKEPFDLLGALQGFKSDPRVERVDLEVMSQSYGKN